MLSYELLQTVTGPILKLSKDGVDRSEGICSKNMCFFNHFSTTPSRLACKMPTNYPGLI